MAIYKDIGFGTVMGLSEDDLKKRPKKRNFYKERVSKRVTKPIIGYLLTDFYFYFFLIWICCVLCEIIFRKLNN